MRNGLIDGLIGGLFYGLIGGLILGLIGGLIDGLIDGLKADISIRVKPNQGIWSSFKNTLILAGLSILPVVIFLVGLPYLLGNILDAASISVIMFLGSISLIWASIFNSSNACAKHFALRLVLHRTNAIPCRVIASNLV